MPDSGSEAIARIEAPIDDGPLPGDDVRDRSAVRPWFGVVSMALGTFSLVTAEFLPAGLLTPMADGLNISPGTAGQAVTATAAAAFIAAPTLGIVTGRLDRRLVLLGLSVMMVASCLLTDVAGGLAELLVARVLLGIALGGFWSMSAAITLRLVPPDMVPRAMSVVLTGVSLATVCAVPVGAWIGEVWGWRAAYAAAAGVGLLALATQVLAIPPLPPVGVSSLRTLGQVLSRPAIRLALGSIILIVSGHFAGFTYVRLFLEQGPKLDVAAISGVLLAFGIGAFVGNFAGAFLVERSLKAGAVLAALTIGVTAVILVLFGQSAAVAIAAVTIWGIAFGAIPVVYQTWLVQSAPDQAEAAGGLMVATFQVAIASGAVLGGLLVDRSGALAALAYTGVAALLCALLVAASKPPRPEPA